MGALGLVSIDVSALTLGRLEVQSVLGEPLRAGVEVTSISAAEADGLKFSIGTPEAFKAAGLPYGSALSEMSVSSLKRPDGSYLVRLNGGRPMNDPFIDLLLEVTWNSGRIMRIYTVLVDPPGARQTVAPVNPTAAQTSLAPVTRPVPAQTPRPVAAAASVAPVPSQQPAPVLRTDSSVVRSTSAGEQQIKVQRGDTASKIAATYKTADVSLDQMLIALLRGNSDAFIGGNVNRIKTGAVLALPSDAQIRTNTPGEATRLINAQSNDFGDYRRRLAEKAPASQNNATDRLASGKLEANVAERNALGNSPDKLKISQGGLTGATADDTLAQSRQAQETNVRAVELAKNLEDLKKLQAASGSASTPIASAPTISGAPAVLAVPVEPLASAAAPVSVPALSVPAKPAVAVVATPVVAPASGFLARLKDSPLMLGAAALIAALIAFLLYRVLGGRRSTSADSVFIESKIPNDSFFKVDGGQQIDANDRHSSSFSSLSYSSSQLDASDVDPVAEADVYLAYGRDLQAEEILREAMRTHPERVAIPLKLLEIHAKRRDLRAFEALTIDIRKLTGGAGLDWTHAIELGRDLDPDNSLYQADAPTATATASPVLMPPNATSISPIEPAAASAPLFVHSVAPLDFDLDIPTPSRREVAPLPENDIGVAADVDTGPNTLQAAKSTESGFEFDMDWLPKHQLPDVSAAQPSHPDETEGGGEDPHTIKLSLARELQALGDIEGARSLVQEVANEGSAELQVKARQLLTQLAN